MRDVEAPLALEMTMLVQSRILIAATLMFWIAGQATAQQREKPVFDAPKGWRSVEPGPLVTVRFVVVNEQTPGVTVMQLGDNPASVPANVNRWRAQLDLPAVPDAEAMKLVRPLKIDGLDMNLVDLTGSGRSAQRIVVAFTRRAGAMWYFRLSGPADAIAEQKPAFDAFVKSIRFERIPENAPAAAPLLDGKTLEAWLKELKSDKHNERQKANDALARIQRDLGGAIPTLRDLTFDEEMRHNAQASDLFKYLGRSAVPALIQGVWDEEPRTRAASVLLLRQDGLDAQAAIPSLLHALKDRNEIIRRLACGTLADLDAYTARSRLVEMLEDPEGRVRIAAARALISLDGEPEPIIRVLIKEISTPKGDFAEYAAETLALLGPEAASAAKTVGELLVKAPPFGQRHLIDTLASIGPAAKPALPALKKVMLDNPESRTAAALAMWTIAEDKDALSALRDEMNSTRDTSAVLAATAVWQIKEDPAAIDDLIRLAKRKETAGQAIWTLAKIGPPAKAAVPMLMDQLGHADPDLGARAAHALGRIGADAKAALPALIKAAGAKDELLRVTAVTARCRIQPDADAISALGKLLQTNLDVSNRMYAVRELQKVWDHAKPVVPVMKELLTDSDESVRAAAAVALWRTRRQPPESLPPLIALLRSTRWEVRETVTRDIGSEFGRHGESAAPALAKLLWDPFNLIRMAAAEELGRIGPGAKDAVPALTAALEANAAPGCVSAACETLGRIGVDAKPALPVLKRLLTHPNKLVQVHAALALLLIAEDKSGVKQLEAGMGDRNYRVRITAAEGLWRARKDIRVVSALVGALRVVNLLDDDAKNNEPFMLIRALGRIGPEAADAFQAILAIHRFRHHYDNYLAETSFSASMRLMPAAFPRED